VNVQSAESRDRHDDPHQAMRTFMARAYASHGAPSMSALFRSPGRTFEFAARHSHLGRAAATTIFAPIMLDLDIGYEHR